MPTVLSQEEYQARLTATRPDVAVLEQYRGYKVKINHRFSCGCEKMIAPNNVLKNGTDCRNCNKIKITKKNKCQSTEQYQQRLSELGDVIVLGQFVNVETKIAHRFACGHERIMRPSDILYRNRGCNVCKPRKKSHEQYQKDLDALGTDIIALEKYDGSRNKIKHRFACGHENFAKPKNILAHHGCATCNQKNNLTEDAIFSAINEHFSCEVRSGYVHDALRDDVNGRHNQHYDVYIPSLKIAIEYNGEQHYVANDFFGGVDRLEKTQKLDAKKRGISISNNIVQIDIGYGVFNYRTKSDDRKKFLENLLSFIEGVAKTRDWNEGRHIAYAPITV